MIATKSSRKREPISNHLPLLLHMGQAAYVNEGGIVAFELPIPVLRFYRGFPNAQVSVDRFVFGKEIVKVMPNLKTLVFEVIMTSGMYLMCKI